MPGFAPIPVQAGKPQATAGAASTSKPAHGTTQGRPSAVNATGKINILLIIVDRLLVF